MIFFFYNYSWFSKQLMSNAVHWERMWQHPRIYTRYEGGTKVQFITDWAQRVNGSYSLFDILERKKKNRCGPREDPCHIIQLSAASFFSLCPWLRPAEERQTRQGGGEPPPPPPHLWVSLLPRKPCLAYLTPVSDDITWQDCPLTMRDSLQCPAWTQRQAERYNDD